MRKKRRNVKKVRIPEKVTKSRNMKIEKIRKKIREGGEQECGKEREWEKKKK